jgi:hypothetical protein
LLGKATSIIAGAFPIRRALAASSKSLAERCTNHHLKQAVELLTCDEARRIVVNIAKLSELLQAYQKRSHSSPTALPSASL